jgi:osmotically-inducible protein OsmY
MFKLLIVAAAGAVAARWFLDPKEGEQRRTDVRGKALATIGKVKDRASDTGRSPASERLNDPALQAKIESEVFRAADAPKGSVSVNVEDGIAYLRGEIEDRATIESLGQAVAKVDGVRGVDNLLHAPGEPAPAKDESHSTAGTGT